MVNSITVTLLLLVASCICVVIVRAQNVDHIPVAPPANADKNWALNAMGGHQRGVGTDVYAFGQKQLWQSDNKRHEVHGGASYGQHFGGPWGNSRPQVGVGATYVHRFGG